MSVNKSVLWAEVLGWILVEDSLEWKRLASLATGEKAVSSERMKNTD